MGQAMPRIGIILSPPDPAVEGRGTCGRGVSSPESNPYGVSALGQKRSFLLASGCLGGPRASYVRFAPKAVIRIHWSADPFNAARHGMQCRWRNFWSPTPGLAPDRARCPSSGLSTASRVGHDAVEALFNQERHLISRDRSPTLRHSGRVGSTRGLGSHALPTLRRMKTFQSHSILRAGISSGRMASRNSLDLRIRSGSECMPVA